MPVTDRHNSTDAAIDRAILEIMSAEPRPGFTSRVLRRLSQEPQAAALPWARWGLTAAALSVAATALLVWMRPAPAVAPVPAPAADRSSIASQAPAGAPAPPNTAGLAAAIPTGTHRAPTAPIPRRGIVEAASIVVEEDEGAAMAATDSEVPAPTERPEEFPRALDLAAITLEPIRIKEIAIPPLSAGGK